MTIKMTRDEERRRWLRKVALEEVYDTQMMPAIQREPISESGGLRMPELVQFVNEIVDARQQLREDAAIKKHTAWCELLGCQCAPEDAWLQ